MLDGHSSVVWQSNIYIWGGKEETSGSRSNVVYSNTMYLVNPSDCISKPAATLEKLFLASGDETGGSSTAVAPRGRAYHCANLYGKLMFITGGLSEEPTSPDGNGDTDANNALLPAFDMERRVWLMKSTFGDVPSARCHHVATIYGDTLMVHGGYPVLNDRSKELTSDEMISMQHSMYDVHELNMATMRWRRVHTTQSPALWGHSCITFGKNVIVFGGVDVVENAETGAVAVWHTEKKAWRWADFQNLDLRCAMHTAVQDSGRMFVFSGVSFKSHQKLRTLYEFNFEFGSWRELHPKGTQPLGRIGHSAVAYNQCMLVIGGSAEQQNNSSMSGGRVERVVHVYNTTLNEWRTCALVSPQQAAGTVQRFQAKEKSWTAGALDESAMSGAKQEWEQTSHQVQSTIAKAKAIQSLAEAAAGTLQHAGGNVGGTPAAGAPSPGGSSYRGLDHSNMQTETMDPTAPAPISYRGNDSPNNGAPSPASQDYMPLNSSGRPVVPFDDGRREEEERLQHKRLMDEFNASPGVPTENGRGMSRIAQTESTPAQTQLDSVRALREGASNEESRRVIEHLQRENDKLKSQLEDFRATSATGPFKNPYEVPIYNPKASPSRTLPENEGFVSPTEASTARARASAYGTASDLVPRLNLNIADPPRASGGGTGGYMSRSSVSAMVQSSLNKDVKASASLALPPPSARVTSMDPMSFLTSPGMGLQSQAGAQPGGVRAPYEQLVARPAVPSISSGDAASMPLTLQPLLTLIGNTPGAGAALPQQPGGVAAAGYTPGMPSPVPMANMTNTSFAPSGYGGAAPSIPNMSFASAAAPQTPTVPQTQQAPTGGGSNVASQYKSPSLRQIVNGQASMLSLPPRK